MTAGSILSAVSGAVSAFTTKTFLDTHKLCLNQLNQYYKQPMQNTNILMAQKFADEVEDQESRKQAYEEIITKITQIIESNDTSP